MSAGIVTGEAAVRWLQERYPDAYRFFGGFGGVPAFPDMESFVRTISCREWLVLCDEHCWMLTQIRQIGVREVHWFCPRGVKIKALRRMISHIFDHTLTTTLCGVTPDDHKNKLAARVVNRALGAKKIGAFYYLSSEDFAAYNRRGSRVGKRHHGRNCLKDRRRGNRRHLR